MATTRRTIAATPAQVWHVLSDGWLYPVWVVGATRMRQVDDHWPAVGARLHHSVGVWPMTLDDVTEVVESTEGSVLELEASAWPHGKAKVTIRLEPDDDGTEVTMEEGPISGPATLVPRPVLDVPLGWRNVESLRRLAFIAEGRS